MVRENVRWVVQARVEVLFFKPGRRGLPASNYDHGVGWGYWLERTRVAQYLFPGGVGYVVAKHVGQKMS